MARLNALIAAGEVCCCLRAKTLFYQTEDHDKPDAEQSGESGAAGPFWCAETQSLLGPDGKVADVENCRAGRECCQTA